MNTETKQSGFLLVDKPTGPTSHDIVNQLRKITEIKKIGHAGTLDPFASGLLIIAMGREATREISNFVKLDKEYIATLFLGATTTTHDTEGKITSYSPSLARRGVGEVLSLAKPPLGLPPSPLERDKLQGEKIIRNILLKFLGPQKQTPPMFSAKKVGGKKLYELARAGETIEREPVDINIFELELLNYEYPILKIRTRVSSGTYIRVLAHDIGQTLGCGAYLTELRRTKIGDFQVDNAQTLEKISPENWPTLLINP